MSPPEQALLGRILRSREFSQAASLRKILRYLCSRPHEALKEYEIALDALGRPPSFDPRTDPIVRVSMAAIRDRLRSYFEGDGAGETLRLTIPKGQYRAVFSPAPTPASPSPAPAAGALQSFWAPYREGGRPILLVLGELLFYRDAHGNFFRNIYVNDLRTGSSELVARIPSLDGMALRPSFHFVSAGEVHCAFSLLRLFYDWGSPVEARNSRFCSWQELRDANVILLGSSRVNPFVAALQETECFQVRHDHIANLRPAPGERERYEGRRYFQGQLERLTEFALVTRKPGIAPGSVVTILSGNHGRVMEATAGFLSSHEQLASTRDQLGLAPGQNWPPHFQILLSVELVDFDEEVVSVDYVSHRICTD